MRNTKNSFSSLQREHAALEHLLDSHQRALQARDVNTALVVLSTFVDVLDQHIEYEEHTLLPLYIEDGGETEDETLRILQAEHRKLRDGMARLTRETGALYVSTNLAGSILALLDEETIFKGLFRHHVLLEQTLPFPAPRCTNNQRTADEDVRGMRVSKPLSFAVPA